MSDNGSAENGSVKGLVFKKLRDFTARDMARFYNVLEQKKAKTIAKYVQTCPKEWGAPDDAETYNALPLRVFWRVSNAFSVGVAAADGKPVDKLRFDMDKVHSTDFDELTIAGTKNLIRSQADVMARVALSCPSGWGDANDPSTYLDLSWATFVKARGKLQEEIEDLMGN